MSGWLPEIEGWVKVAGVLVGVVMAVLVPIRSWIVEDRRYRAQMLEATASASRTVSAAVQGAPVASAGGGGLCGVVEMEGLIAALHDCAAALRESTRIERALGQERLMRAIDRIADRKG